MGEQPKPELYELNNGSIRIKITNYGAIVTHLFVPDRHGNVADIVLGFDSIESYMKDNSPYFGCIVGRVANRIRDGKFALNGVHYTLPVNNGPNSLHGYPGDVTATATYALTSSKTMRLDMEAVPKNKATPINLAQHTYWNLAGHNSGDVLDHSLQIWGSQITPVDQNSIPTGEFLPVKGTAFDFTSEKKIGNSITDVPGLGYDHNYVLDCGEEKIGLKHAAKVKDPSGSRVLDLWTDAPGMQFYTANYVNGVAGKEGAVYEKHSGLCLETQGFPNAINQSNFPSIVVQPGEKYKQTMLFEFSAE
ncbi:Aldose 1-epimerase [Citrus sinensis]|uniref:Aldose 1-epimerase n=1 Tax=Citrus sinensis TaxID=2711 RepID=A0ACB8K4Q2_CITSI|nr:Aldose 1-epimerase [Citrus sinensis]